MAATQKRTRIELKDNIPADVRTDGKDDAARIIQEKIETGEWPVPLTELAENTGWSRSHFSNTIDDYFKPVEKVKTQNDSNSDSTKDRNITIPSNVECVSDYLQGVAAGWNMKRSN